MKLEFSQAGKLPAKVKDQLVNVDKLPDAPATVTGKDGRRYA